MSARWYLLLVVTGLLPAVLFGQIVDKSVSSKGQTFWCAFLENLDLSMNDAPEFTFQIEADQAVTGTITLVATGLSVPFSVSAGTVASVTMPPAIYYPQGSESVTDYGILITASDHVQVKAVHWRTYFSETTGVLPLAELGSHYLAQGYRYKGDDQSSFVIVATEDHTVVSITPTAVTFNGRPAGQPFPVELNRGQTYQVRSLGDLAGTEIQSPADKPVAVFGGAKQSNAECNTANSHLYDQCLPLDRGWLWGQRFFAVPFYGQGSSVLRVLASEDDTQVQLNCDTVATLQKGQAWTGLIGFSLDNMVYADKPVAVSQLARGVACSGTFQNGDPMLLNLLPEGVYTQNVLVRVPKRASTGLSFVNNTLTVITKLGQSNNIRLNGAPISNYPHTPLGQQWEFTRVFVLPDSTYRLQADATPFQAYLHGFDYANAYAHWVGFDRVVLDTADTSVALLAPDSACVDFAFTLAVQGGALQWVALLNNGQRQNLDLALPLTIYQPGTALFSAAIRPDGACQPQLVYAQTVVTQCPPPPDSCPVYIPNVFTPNGDQLNDLFAPLPAECSFSDYEFSIYNRWGQLIFYTRQPFAGWNGKTAGGQDAPGDVYVWTLTYRRYPGAEQIRRAGDVTLLR